jgi:hypothetical protein
MQKFMANNVEAVVRQFTRREIFVAALHDFFQIIQPKHADSYRLGNWLHLRQKMRYPFILVLVTTV